ncbi:MAG: hypothetical protein KGJ80_03395 [Chloroflexota bacterium]|nr:hypothetical protein [Chloroflexota bacterium]
MKWLPTAIAIAVGLVVLFDFFFALPLLDAIGAAFREWTILLTAFALLLGLINLLSVHLMRVIRRTEPNTGYSLLVLITTVVVFLVGLLFGLPSAPMTWLFDNVYVPLQGAFFALVAFFLATAAYRALRARSIETTLMLLAALIVFVGQAPLLNALTQAKDWVLNVPSTAGARGILLGVALGTIATGLRLIVGLDRPYSE